jgi:hypothetical protein
VSYDRRLTRSPKVNRQRAEPERRRLRNRYSWPAARRGNWLVARATQCGATSDGSATGGCWRNLARGRYLSWQRRRNRNPQRQLDIYQAAARKALIAASAPELLPPSGACPRRHRARGRPDAASMSLHLDTSLADAHASWFGSLRPLGARLRREPIATASVPRARHPGDG